LKPNSSKCSVSYLRRLKRCLLLTIWGGKVHKAARMEKGHLIRPTLGPLLNIRQSQLATSAQRWQYAIRLAKCMIAFSVAAGLSIRQQWVEETSDTLVEKMAHPRHHTRSNLSVFIMRRDSKLHYSQYLQCSRRLFSLIANP
jgi:hypothetical protein